MDINDYDEFEDISDKMPETENYEVEEITDEEAETITGGGVTYALKEAVPVFETDSSKKGYSKHCGGIRLGTNSTQISVAQVGARVGKIDKVYITQSSIPVNYMISGPMAGPDTIQVIRRTSRND